MVFVPGHSNINGNEPADKQAESGYGHLLPHTAVICQIVVMELNEVFTRSPVERKDADMSMIDIFNLIRFHSGHYPDLRRWQHLTDKIPLVGYVGKRRSH